MLSRCGQSAGKFHTTWCHPYEHTLVFLEKVLGNGMGETDVVSTRGSLIVWGEFSTLGSSLAIFSADESHIWLLNLHHSIVHLMLRFFSPLVVAVCSTISSLLFLNWHMEIHTNAHLSKRIKQVWSLQHASCIATVYTNLEHKMIEYCIKNYQTIITID